MKRFVILFIVFISVRANAHSFSKTPADQPFINRFTLNFSFFELGNSKSFKEKRLSTMSYGMDKYLNNRKPGGSGSFFGLELWYKNKIGIEVLFTGYSFNCDDTKFNNFIAEKYSNYYVRYVIVNNFSSYGVGYRINYKRQFKQFQLTTKFQIGNSDYRTIDNHTNFKEKGSNQFLEYTIEKKNLMKNTMAYHFILDFSRKINFEIPFEIGIKTELMATPTLFQYTITEKSYGGNPTVNQFNVKQNFAGWSVGIVLRFNLLRYTP